MPTPIERARNIGWCTCPIGTGGDTIGGAHGPHCLVTQIADAIREAVEAEREARAQLMGEWKASLLDAEAAMRAAERKALFAASDMRERCAQACDALPAYNDPQDCAAMLRALD